MWHRVSYDMFVRVNKRLHILPQTVSSLLSSTVLSKCLHVKYAYDKRFFSKSLGISKSREPMKYSDPNENSQNELHNISVREIQSDLSIISPNGNVDLETFAPYVSPSFNFAAYVNKSSTLKELVKLGVTLHVWEKKKGIPEFVLRLDFERDMKDIIRFLHDSGVSPENLGVFITKNPLIFKEKIEDLEVRISYLESKRFTPEMIAQIVTKNPFWLMFSTIRIDRRLGYFQQSFKLRGAEVRALCTKLPRLITYNLNHIKEVTFAIKEIMGFQEEEIKEILLRKPKLWMTNNDALISRFNYLHNEMGIPHSQLVKNPSVLSSRLQRIQQRHQFLHQFCSEVEDGKSRYDPKSIGYISLEKLVSGNDAEFCNSVAKVSIESFNAFLKSL